MNDSRSMLAGILAMGMASMSGYDGVRYGCGWHSRTKTRRKHSKSQRKARNKMALLSRKRNRKGGQP